MASVIEGNNLYPPIIEDYMPAFVNSLIINFNISPFNTADQFNLETGIQISIRDQKTNKSVLNPAYAPNEILFVGATINNISFGSGGENKISFSADELKKILREDHFKLNSYYKIQIRFTKAGIFPPNSFTNQASWLAANINNFTEWSTVCLIRRISEPILTINNYNEELDMLKTFIISGRVDFLDSEEQESLYKYKIQLQIKKEIVEEKILYFNTGLSNREFYYEFKTSIEDTSEVKAHIYITTTNGYEIKKSCNIFISEEGALPLTRIKNIYVDEENGGFKLFLRKDIDSIGNKAKKLFIKRTDSRSGFNVWENVHSFNVNKNYIDLEWEDLFVESGVWYKYAIVEQYTYSYSKKLIYDIPVMGIFEHMYLIGADKEGVPIQLKIKYNQEITSYKKNISEQRIETIGGKFPFVRRNGDTNYTSFNISGLISYLSEENLEENYFHSDLNEEIYSTPKNLFISLNDLYGGEEQLNLYNNYNLTCNISKYRDITLEKEFRKKVIDFLTNGKIKVLKTAQEGNFLVKTMNVNLTPENQLGRKLYSFSCEVFEMADFTVENCIKYVLETIQEYEIAKPMDGAKIEEEFSSFSIKGDTFVINIIPPVENITLSTYNPFHFFSENFSFFQIKDVGCSMHSDLSIENIEKVSVTDFQENLNIQI